MTFYFAFQQYNTKFTLEIFQWFSSGHNKTERYANISKQFHSRWTTTEVAARRDGISSKVVDIERGYEETNTRFRWITNFKKNANEFWLLCTGSTQFHFSSGFNERKLPFEVMAQYYQSLWSTLRFVVYEAMKSLFA